MAERSRLEELERRVASDPASIAFAQLAEEYRRADRFEDAVRVCRSGLARHPAYLSARVTLGRALIELEQYREARRELERVVREAPDNLSAIRALADLHQRGGELSGEDPAEGAVDDEAVMDAPFAAPPQVVVTPADLDLALPHTDDDLTRALRALDALDLHELARETAEVQSPFEPADLDIPAGLLDSEFVDGRSSFDPDASLSGIDELATAAEPLLDTPARLTMWAPSEPAEPPSRHELDGTLDLLPPVMLPPAIFPEPVENVDPRLVALERWLDAIVSDRARRS